MNRIARAAAVDKVNPVMGDSSNSKPGSRPGGGIAPARTPAAGEKPQAPAQDPSAGRSGRVIHDARGNAVWDWVKDTARTAIDSTSRLLKKLEISELTMEDTQNGLRGPDSKGDAGGGYDPYGRSAPAKGFTRREGSNSSRNNSPGTSRGTGNTNNVGGGYDPYGKGVTRKPRG
jgi:hypothetical protein